jgi:hypothetical protein
MQFPAGSATLHLAKIYHIINSQVPEKNITQAPRRKSTQVCGHDALAKGQGGIVVLQTETDLAEMVGGEQTPATGSQLLHGLFIG